MGTSSFFSRDDDDNIDTGSTAARDDIALVVPALVDDDDNDHCDNYSPSCTSTPKRQKVIDGIFRPSSSASASLSSLSPPPLLPKSASFYHDITALSHDELSFLALPDCPSSASASASASSSLSVTSLPKISLAPRCLEFLP